MVNVDFHTHTTCSDGNLDFAAVINFAKNIGLELIAISDHDSYRAWDMKRYEREKTRVLDDIYGGLQERNESEPGKLFSGDLVIDKAVEFTSWHKNREFDIQAHFVEAADLENQFGDHFEKMKAARILRAQDTVAALNKNGYRITWDWVSQEAGRYADGIHSAHLAKALIKANQKIFSGAGVKEIITNILPMHRKPLREYYSLPGADDFVKGIRNIAGIPVIAHFDDYESLDLDETIAHFMQCTDGLLGVEISNRNYTESAQKELEDRIRKQGALVFRGSDFHGTGHYLREELGVEMGKDDFDKILSIYDSIKGIEVRG
jgi:hypothetical protein